MKKMRITKLSPFGVKIEALSEKMALEDVSISDIQTYLTSQKLIVLRNFIPPSKETLTHFSKKLGPILEWEFGHVMEMTPSATAKNYLFTRGHVPFHWDGAFHQAPQYLIFHCIESYYNETGGETLFCNTEFILNNASKADIAHWKTLSLTSETEKVAHYGGKIVVPLLQKHPKTNCPILRFAEPVPETLLNPVTVFVNELAEQDSNEFIQLFSEKCYAMENCYTHVWQENDLLICDNLSLLHARNAFNDNARRHLRRIQVLFNGSNA